MASIQVISEDVTAKYVQKIKEKVDLTAQFKLFPDAERFGFSGQRLVSR